MTEFLPEEKEGAHRGGFGGTGPCIGRRCGPGIWPIADDTPTLIENVFEGAQARPAAWRTCGQGVF